MSLNGYGNCRLAVTPRNYNAVLIGRTNVCIGDRDCCARRQFLLMSVGKGSLDKQPLAVALSSDGD